jgi:hypothetical protein
MAGDPLEKKRSHPYEIYLKINQIKHQTSKVGRPQTKGLLERFAALF